MDFFGRGRAKDGKVVMPLEKTFWAARFAMVVDRFGIPWLINCEGPISQRKGKQVLGRLSSCSLS